MTINSKDVQVPFILYAPLPPEGHMQPALQICTYLAEQGFDVTLLGRSRWEAAVEAAGVHFALLSSSTKGGDVEAVPEIPTEVMTMPLGPLLSRQFGDRFAKKIVESWDDLRFALVDLRHRVGLDALQTRGIVILSDTGFEGTLPLQLGARRPSQLEAVAIRTLGIGVVPRFWATPYHPPWGLGMPYDGSEAGIHRTLQAHSEQKALYESSGGEDKARLVLDMYGCDRRVDSLFAGYETFTSGQNRREHRVSHSFLDAVTACHDTTLQMSTESLEFPVPAGAAAQPVPPSLRHAGFLPTKKLPPDLEYPPWFHEVTSPRASSSRGRGRGRGRGRSVVVVAQGTQSDDYHELVVPTMRALAADEDVLVVAVLCRRGAGLPAGAFGGAPPPPNARVLDYFPYDAVLPHADVFVSGSGFGGLAHAVANAVPLLQCGWIVDKPDIGRRVERSGLGLYLGREAYPADAGAVRAAVGLILSSPDRYKRRGLELQAESLARYQPLQTIKEEIMALGARH